MKSKSEMTTTILKLSFLDTGVAHSISGQTTMDCHLVSEINKNILTTICVV
jgi:hypothetical protein